MTATELIFDEKGKTVTGFQDLDPKTLSMHFDTTTAKFVWIQYANNGLKERIINHDRILITNK